MKEYIIDPKGLCRPIAVVPTYTNVAFSSSGEEMHKAPSVLGDIKSCVCDLLYVRRSFDYTGEIDEKGNPEQAEVNLNHNAVIFRLHNVYPWDITKCDPDMRFQGSLMIDQETHLPALGSDGKVIVTEHARVGIRRVRYENDLIFSVPVNTPFEITGRTISGEDFTIKSDVGFTEGQLYIYTDEDYVTLSNIYSVYKHYRSWTDKDNPFMLAQNSPAYYDAERDTLCVTRGSSDLVNVLVPESNIELTDNVSSGLVTVAYCITNKLVTLKNYINYIASGTSYDATGKKLTARGMIIDGVLNNFINISVNNVSDVDYTTKYYFTNNFNMNGHTLTTNVDLYFEGEAPEGITFEGSATAHTNVTLEEFKTLCGV